MYVSKDVCQWAHDYDMHSITYHTLSNHWSDEELEYTFESLPKISAWRQYLTGMRNHPSGFNIYPKSRSVKTILYVYNMENTWVREPRTTAMGSFTNISVTHLGFLFSVSTVKSCVYRSPGYQRWNSAKGRSKSPVKRKVTAATW